MKKFLAVLAMICMSSALLPTAVAQGLKVKATAHGNTLSINPTTSGTGVIVTSYNVYKSLTSGSYSSPVASVPATTGATYVDTAVSSGQKTFYVVTAVCAACSAKESAFSNEVSAVTPPDGPPAPPTISVTAQ